MDLARWIHRRRRRSSVHPKARGLPLLSAEWKQCRDKVAELKDYPAKPLIDRIGWNEPYFALADGTVFSSSGKRPVVLFPKNEHKCAAAGSVKRWRNLTTASASS
ncbi:MAG TPA: hypothetical protein VLM18_07525 [Croceibacterium sp.]|nr:hypothetical protein [Croceibacterium sp.]